MDTNDITSGFVNEEPLLSVGGFDDISEVYSSTSGYSRLYRCERMGKLYILKTLQAVYVGSDFYEQALRKEFTIGYELEHPNICHTVSWEQIEGLGHCILLEYVDGITLKQFIEQGKLTRPLAEKFITELCSALQYLHSKQIIHRDLKPANILITHNGNNVKLIDFGLSDCDDYDVLKLPAGTRYYLAPEALTTGVTLDLRADIYSLGVILGEMATILHDKSLASLSRKCTQRKREKRLASVAEVVSTLQKKRESVYRYVAAFIALIVITGGIIGYLDADKATPIPFPVYGNSSRGDACRRILAEERIRLQQKDVTETMADSTRLLERLKVALDKEFPLASQRESFRYQHEWESLKQEVARLYSSTMVLNLPQ